VKRDLQGPLTSTAKPLPRIRTHFWCFYDWMRGLHIMDFKTRKEDTHNPLVIGFGLLALATTVLAIILLPLTIRRRT
jgi:hypothetical protein